MKISSKNGFSEIRVHQQMISSRRQQVVKDKWKYEKKKTIRTPWPLD